MKSLKLMVLGVVERKTTSTRNKRIKGGRVGYATHKPVPNSYVHPFKKNYHVSHEYISSISINESVSDLISQATVRTANQRTTDNSEPVMRRKTLP